MPILDESKRPAGSRTPSVYSEPYRYGYVPNGSSTPVLTPQGRIAQQYTSNTTDSRGNPVPGASRAPNAYEMLRAYQGLNSAIGQPNPGSGAMMNLNGGATASATARRGGGGGGRGGGGGGTPGLTQQQMDYIAQLLKAGRPQQEGFTPLNMPAYQGMAMRAFDPSQFDQLQASFGQAVNQDRASIDTAYNNEDQYLKSNYKNAFAGGPPPSQPPGMDQTAMARLLQSQGVNPASNQQVNNQQQGAAAANAAFGNVWGLLGANEDTAQGNRLLRSQQDRATSNQALNAAALQGNTGIGLQRTQAQTAWQQAADQRAYQDYQMQQQLAQQNALQNWQRQNQVTDTNTTGGNSYNSALIQQLLQLIPNFQGNMPDLSALGF